MRQPEGAERAVFNATLEFSLRRMSDPAMIAWALGLESFHQSEQAAIRQALIVLDGKLKPAFRDAWRWVVHSWESKVGQSYSRSDRYLAGRDGVSVTSAAEFLRLIVAAVSPRLIVASQEWEEGTRTPRVKSFRDLVRFSIRSYEWISAREAHLDRIREQGLTHEAALLLNSALLDTLVMADRVGLITEAYDPTCSMLSRVYFTQNGPGDQHDDDQYTQGCAPCVKLLFAIVSMLADDNDELARQIVNSWAPQRWQLHRRLWAAAARDTRLVEADALAGFLRGASQREFWSVGRYPEIAEVRARRWNSFNGADQRALERRICKGPPASLVSRHIPQYERVAAIQRRALIEVRRIRALGGTFSQGVVEWLETMDGRFPPDAAADPLTEGFGFGVRVGSIELVRGDHYSHLERENLLPALQRDLSTDQMSDAHDSAVHFISTRTDFVLQIFVQQRGSFPRVLEMIAYELRPSDDKDISEEDRIEPGRRFCELLSSTSAEDLAFAVESLTFWLQRWAFVLRRHPLFPRTWLRLWPIALTHPVPGDPDAVRPEDILSLPSASMAAAIINGRPVISEGASPFRTPPWDEVLARLGGELGDHQLPVLAILLRAVAYFFKAEPEWTMRCLVEPLRHAAVGKSLLWDAFARPSWLPPREVTLAVKAELLAAVLDPLLPESTRQNLATYVTHVRIRCRLDETATPIEDTEIQQILRRGGTSVRKTVALVLLNYLRNKEDPLSAEERFDRIVVPFFRAVWPQERTLASPETSEHLAALPIAAGQRFVQAVELIAEFLSPFDCWTLSDYGAYDEDPRAGIAVVRGPAAAEAFLTLLDRTIGGTERAVVPYHLDRALDFISRQSPLLVRSAEFQRLLSLARR